MALTAQDVARLADLARIELTDDELARLVPQLDVILTSVASVGQLADQDIPPTSHPLHLENIYRDDVLQPSYAAQSMLAGAPAVEDAYFRVPRILDEEA